VAGRAIRRTATICCSVSPLFLMAASLTVAGRRAGDDGRARGTTDGQRSG